MGVNGKPSTITMMFKYADGYINEVSPSGTLNVGTEAYPDWWLKAVDYQDGPPPVPPASVTYPAYYLCTTISSAK